MESMALNAPGATERPQSFTTNSPAPSAASLGPSGATAQTSGFAQAGRKDSATAIPSQFGYLADPASGGGLASSPNVPKPGSTINLATGKPHVEGLTRAELAAMQSKGKGLLDPTPQPEAARRSSIVECVLAEEEAMEGTKEGRRLSDLSGREQAARQLMGTAGAGTGSNNSVQSTPGIEMPGGWGPVKQVPVPGSGPNAPSSIYEDVAGSLQKVGTAAYSVIPVGIKEVFSNQPLEPQAPGSPKARRGSAATLLDQAKVQTNRIVHDVEETLREATRPNAGEPAVLRTVKGFLGEVIGGTVVVPGAVALKTSLPSNEPAGARPGERSSGVGALPGKSTETGVAVLPDEKKTPSTLPSQENQGRLPGETPAGVGALPGKESETGVAVLSDERGERFVIRYYIELTGGPSGTSAQASSTTDRSMKDVMNSFAGSASTGGTGIDQPTDAMVPASAVSASAPEFTTRSALPTDSNTMGASTTNSTGQSSNFTSTSATAVSMTDNDDLVPSAGISGSRAYIGLAAALPSTFLGQGADHGATNGKNKLGIKEYSGPPSSSFATSSGPESNSLPGINESSATTPVSLSPSSAGAPDTRYSNDRTTSSASVTAIRGGTEGSRPSPLAAQPVTLGSTDSSAGNVVTTEQKSTTAGTGPNHTTSLSPGDEKDAVGHPSTMGMSGTSREPGSYPIADRGSSKTAASALGGNAAGKATSSPSKSMSSSGTQTGTQTSSGTQTGTLGSAGTIEPRSSTASTPTTTSSTAKTPSTPTTASSTTAATSTSPSTPKSPAGHTSAAQKTTSATSSVQKTASPTKDASVHQRTASNVSSEGGKKKGFMSKLKEKLAS